VAYSLARNRRIDATLSKFALNVTICKYSLFSCTRANKTCVSAKEKKACPRKRGLSSNKKGDSGIPNPCTSARLLPIRPANDRPNVQPFAPSAEAAEHRLAPWISTPWHDNFLIPSPLTLMYTSTEEFFPSFHPPSLCHYAHCFPWYTSLTISQQLQA